MEIKVVGCIKVVNHKALNWRDCLGLSGWAQCSNKEERSRRGLERLTRRSENWRHGSTLPNVAGFEDGERAVKKCWQALDIGKGKEVDFALEYSDRNQSR